MVIIRIDSERPHCLDDTLASLHSREKSGREIRDQINILRQYHPTREMKRLQKEFLKLLEEYVKTLLILSLCNGRVLIHQHKKLATGSLLQVTQMITKIERNCRGFRFIDYGGLKVETFDDIGERRKQLITEIFAIQRFSLHNTSRATRDL